MNTTIRLLTYLIAAGPLFAQVSDAPPPAAEQQALTAKIKQSAMRFRGQLPDFICTEVETRWEDTSGTGNKWKLRDALEMLVHFAQDGRTAIKLILPTPIFSAKDDPQFQWSRWDELAGRRVAAFAFRAQPIVKNYPDGKRGFLLAFHGLVYADPADGMVLRLETHTDAPQGYPFEDGSGDVDYRAVTISNRKLILPVKATTRLRRGKLLSRNEMQFTEYRKYEADSTVTFGDDH